VRLRRDYQYLFPGPGCKLPGGHHNSGDLPGDQQLACNSICFHVCYYNKGRTRKVRPLPAIMSILWLPLFVPDLTGETTRYGEPGMVL